MAAGHVRLLPELRLHQVQRQHWAALGGLVERRMVLPAQVALEPDYLG